jgi:prolyl 4-hydroxylase
MTAGPAGSDPRLVWEQAAKGDPAAQLFLARAHEAAGKGAEAAHWLAKAAAMDYPPALTYRGETALLSGATAEGARDIVRAAALGDPVGMRLQAQILMSGLLASEQAWTEAAGWLLQAAEAGDKAAQRELAMMLDMAGAPGSNLLLEHAAQAGDAVAVDLVLRRDARMDIRLEPGRRDAYRLALMRLHGPSASAPPSNAALFPPPGQLPAPDWVAIGVSLAAEPEAPIPTPERLSMRPNVSIVRGLMTGDECAYVVALARPFLAPARIVDPVTGRGREDPIRTNLATAFSRARMTCTMTQLARRLAAAARTPLDNAEPPGVLAYNPGQEYRPHFDWLGSGPLLDKGGQRLRTALVYLNADYTGGQTRFVDAGLDIPAGQGDCAIFDNTGPDGAPDTTSRHAGLPVTAGVKYLWSQWYRARPYAH